MSRPVTTFLCSFILVFGSGLVLNLAEARYCAAYGRGAQIPSGYHPPYNLFDGAHTLVVYPNCRDFDVRAEIGAAYDADPADPDPNYAIHKKGYYWDASQDEWTEFPITFPSSPIPPDNQDWINEWTIDANYIRGTGYATLDYISEPTYFVAYFCVKVAGQWKCGCKDTGCTDRYWQLQAYYEGAVIVGGGTSASSGSSSGSTSSSGSGRPVIGVSGGPFIGTSATNVTGAQTFEGQTGKPVRITNRFMTGASWGEIEGGSGHYSQIRTILTARPNMRVMVSFPLVSRDAGNSGAGLANCASGQFNNHYRQFALSMKERGLNKLILRMGWEFSLTHWPWGVGYDMTKAANYAGCWRQVVNSIQEAYPENDFIYEWNNIWEPYQEYSTRRALLEAAYPGNAYVDVIGMDFYNVWYNKASSQCNFGNDAMCRWNAHLPALNNLRAFAASKGKPVGLSEWGAWSNMPGSGDTRGTGDDPVYAREMCNWVKNSSNNVAYYIYFNALVEEGPWDHRLSTHPQMAEAINQHCEANELDANQL